MTLFNRFKTWMAATVLGSAFRTAIAVALSLAAADWQLDGSINFEHWMVWVMGFALSFIPALITWFNDKDPRWGRGSVKAIEKAKG
jgi:hypothetical protein